MKYDKKEEKGLSRKNSIPQVKSLVVLNASVTHNLGYVPTHKLHPLRGEVPHTIHIVPRLCRPSFRPSPSGGAVHLRAHLSVHRHVQRLVLRVRGGPPALFVHGHR